jgi:hypothetical protein
MTSFIACTTLRSTTPRTAPPRGMSSGHDVESVSYRAFNASDLRRSALLEAT